MTDANYADDLVLLINIPARAKSLLLSLEQAAEGICLYVKTTKIEFNKEPSLPKMADLCCVNTTIDAPPGVFLWYNG